MKELILIRSLRIECYYRLLDKNKNKRLKNKQLALYLYLVTLNVR